MIKFLVILLVILGIIGGIFLFGTKRTATPDLTAANVLSSVNDGALLIDVREPDEFASGHAPQAKNIPLGDITKNGVDAPKDTKIYLYCRSGHRAGLALAALKAKGYGNVVNLGGLSDWQKMGGELVKD